MKKKPSQIFDTALERTYNECVQKPRTVVTIELDGWINVEYDPPRRYGDIEVKAEGFGDLGVDVELVDLRKKK
jgi:hypothetical protein